MLPLTHAQRADERSPNTTAWIIGVSLVAERHESMNISEQPLYRWGPLLCRTQVPSLVDHSGSFYAESQIDAFVRQVNVAELEREFRAQIEHVLQAGVRLTHLDSHCALHIRREAIFTMTLGLAREYGVALRVYDHPFINRTQRQGYSTNGHPLMDSYAVDTTHKTKRYAQMLRTLPVGLSEWAVHPDVQSCRLKERVHRAITVAI